MTAMATPPESTKISLRQRLRAHAQQRWPQVTGLDFRYRGAFAYVDAHLPDGEVLPLLRLRCGVRPSLRLRLARRIGLSLLLGAGSLSLSFLLLG